ncbi:MAG: ASCH domain-containing protein [Candidatus Shapirobacteria bacterium]
MSKETGIRHENQRRIPELSMKRKYLNLINSGEKTKEGRVDSSFFKRLNPGDKIKFFNDSNPYISVICEISEINRYKSFKEMLENEDYSTMIPDAKSLNQAVDVYNNIPTYPERAKENGVLALKLRVIK